MTDINHRRGTGSGKRRHHPRRCLITRVTELGDRSISAAGDPNVGKEVPGAKKYVRSRVRFHENAATRKIASQSEEDEHESNL